MSEHVEIREHGNTYEDVTFCPECGCRKNTVIKRDTYVDDKSFLLIFNRYGDGNTYRCNECECKYVVCNFDKVELKKAKGFAKVLCLCLASILALIALFAAFYTFGELIVAEGSTELFKPSVLCILSTILSAFLFYIGTDA